MKLARGGCAANTSYGLSRLGVDVKLAGKVGKDSFGSFLIDSLKNDNVNVDAVICDNKVNTASCVVLVSEDGERSFCYCPGANETLTKEELDNILRENSFSGPFSKTIIHITSPSKEPQLDIESILAEAGQKGIFSTMDVDWNGNNEWVKKVIGCLKYIDIFFCNEKEGKLLTGQAVPLKMAYRLMEKGAGRVVIKLGGKGSLYADRNQSIKVPGYKVKVVDTTGAGDIFVSGFIAQVIKKGLIYTAEWDRESIESTLKFSNMCGAVCTTRVGAYLDGGSVENIGKAARTAENETMQFAAG
jgi:fructokinase